MRTKGWIVTALGATLLAGVLSFPVPASADGPTVVIGVPEVTVFGEHFVLRFGAGHPYYYPPPVYVVPPPVVYVEPEVWYLVPPRPRVKLYRHHHHHIYPGWSGGRYVYPYRGGWGRIARGAED